MQEIKFAKNVERLIDPISVGTLHFIGPINKLLPKFIQRKLIKSSSKKTPLMGFVVEPYSSFLCYEIIDLKKAESLLPTGFKLIKTKIFDNDEPKYYCIFGCIRAHTSAFWGVRTEFYIIAEDQTTGLLSWIIVDYDTNTISYDTKRGLTSPNSSKSVITINHRGNLYVDIQRDDGKRKLIFDLNVESGIMNKLDQRLWLEGNLSIGYGKELSDDSANIFSLKFEPCEVEKALKIPMKCVNIQDNSWYSGLFAAEPSEVVCFPYAQHFVSDSPGHSSNLKSKQELMAANDALDFEKIKVFSTKSFKTMFLLGSIVSFLLTTTFLLLWLFK